MSILIPVLFAPAPAAAEPVTLNFRVTVDQVFRFDNLPDGIVEPLDPVSFVLSLTYDSAFVSISSGDFIKFGDRGEPLSSPVPLVGSDVELSGGGQVQNTASIDRTGLIHIEDGLEGPTNQWGWVQQTFEIQGRGPAIDAAVPLTHDLFLAYLAATPLKFRYLDYARTDIGTPGHELFVYDPNSGIFQGTATLITAPEPQTFTMLFLGLATMMWRSSKSRKP